MLLLEYPILLLNFITTSILKCSSTGNEKLVFKTNLQKTIINDSPKNLNEN